MRKILILFILIILSTFAFSQTDSLKLQFNARVTFDSISTVNDSVLQFKITGWSDALFAGYLPSGIQEGFGVFDGSGRLFRVDTILSTTASTAWLQVVKLQERTPAEPVGVGGVFEFMTNGMIPPGVANSLNLTPVTQARLLIHNAKISESMSASIEAADGYLPADLAQGDKIVDGNGNALQFGNLKEFKTENFISIPTLDSLYDIPYPVTQASSRVWTECIVVYDNILYWVPGSSGDTLRIYDLNSEDQPVLLSAEITGVGASQPVLRYDNKKLYLSKTGTLNNVDDVSIIDVSDPSNPIKYPIGGQVGWNVSFDVRNGIVYTWGDRKGSTNNKFNIYSLDVSDLNNLSALSFMDTLNIGSASNGGEDALYISGNNLYALVNYTTTNDSFQIFKIGIEKPDSLYLRGTKKIVGEGGFILSAVKDDLVYLIDNADTLEIYDFRMDTLRLVSKTNIPFGVSGPATFAKLQGNYLYVSNTGGFIDVVDVSDISNPFLIKQYPTIANHRGATIWGDRYVAGSRNNGAGVRVHKIGISKHPVVSTGTILSGEGRIDRLKSKNINSETISTDNLILDKAKNASALGKTESGNILGIATDGTVIEVLASSLGADGYLPTNIQTGDVTMHSNNDLLFKGIGGNSIQLIDTSANETLLLDPDVVSLTGATYQTTMSSTFIGIAEADGQTLMDKNEIIHTNPPGSSTIWRVHPDGILHTAFDYTNAFTSNYRGLVGIDSAGNFVSTDTSGIRLNLFNSNGTLTANRTISGGGKTLSLENMGWFSARSPQTSGFKGSIFLGTDGQARIMQFDSTDVSKWYGFWSERGTHTQVRAQAGTPVKIITDTLRHTNYGVGNTDASDFGKNFSGVAVHANDGSGTVMDVPFAQLKDSLAFDTYNGFNRYTSTTKVDTISPVLHQIIMLDADASASGWTQYINPVNLQIGHWFDVLFDTTPSKTITVDSTTGGFYITDFSGGADATSIIDTGGSVVRYKFIWNGTNFWVVTNQ